MNDCILVYSVLLPLSAGNADDNYINIFRMLTDVLKERFNYVSSDEVESKTINHVMPSEEEYITDLAECMIREFFIGEGDTLSVRSTLLERDDSELVIHLLILRAGWVPEGFVPVAFSVAVKGVQVEEFYKIISEVNNVIMEHGGIRAVIRDVLEKIRWPYTLLDANSMRVLDLIAEVMLLRLLMVSLSNIIIQKVNRGETLSDKYLSSCGALWTFFKTLPNLKVYHRNLNEKEVFVAKFLEASKMTMEGEVSLALPVVNQALSSLQLRLNRGLQELSEAQTKIDRRLMWLTIAVVGLSIPTFILSAWELIIRFSSILGWP